MRNLARYVSLVLVIAFLFSPVAVGGGPNIPAPPNAPPEIPSDIQNFVDGIVTAIEAFVSAIIG